MVEKGHLSESYCKMHGRNKMRMRAAKLRAERLARLMRRKAKVAIEIRVCSSMLGEVLRWRCDLAQ